MAENKYSMEDLIRQDFDEDSDAGKISGKYPDMDSYISDFVETPGIAVRKDASPSSQYIKDLNRSKDSGLPTELVTRKSKEIDEQIRYKKQNDTYERLRRDAPKTAGLLQDPVIAPAIIDDVEHYEAVEKDSKQSYLERFVSHTAGKFQHGSNTWERGQIGISLMMGNEITSSQQDTINQIDSAPKGDIYDLKLLPEYSAKDDFIKGLSGDQNPLLTFLKLPSQIGRQYLQQFISESPEIPGHVAEALSTTVEVLKQGGIGAGVGLAAGAGVGFVSGGVPGAVQRGVQGAKIGATVGSAKGGIEVETGNMFMTFREFKDDKGNKIDENVARGAALIFGPLAGSLETGGIMFIAKRNPVIKKLMDKGAIETAKQVFQDPAKRSLLLKLGSEFVKTGSVEGAAEVTQDIIGDIGGELAKQFATVSPDKAKEQGIDERDFNAFNVDGKEVDAADYLLANVEKYQGSFKAGFYGGGGLGATSFALGNSVAGKALFDMESEDIQKGIEATKQSKTHQEDPALYAETTAETLGQENVYIDAAQAADLFQGNQDQFADLIEDVPEIQEQIEEALQVGGNLVLPKNKVFSSLAKESNAEVNQLLSEHLSLSPEAISPKQFESDLVDEIIPEVEKGLDDPVSDLNPEDLKDFESLLVMEDKQFTGASLEQQKIIQESQGRLDESIAREKQAKDQGRPEEDLQILVDETARITAILERATKTKGLIDLARDERGGYFAKDLEDRFSKQLQEAGTDVSTAQAQASVPRAAYEALAGQFKDSPEQLDLIRKQFAGLSVQTEKPKDEIDRLIEDVRKGRAPKSKQIYGPSLMEMLRSEGINDTGGELLNRDVDIGLEAFEKKMISGKGLTLDEAAEYANDRGYINDQDPNSLLEAIDNELSGDKVYSEQNLNAEMLDKFVKFEAVDEILSKELLSADEVSDFDLRKLISNEQIKVFNQPIPGVNATESGVSFDQDFGDLLITDDAVIEETGEEVQIENKAQAVFDDLVGRRESIGKLIECMTA